MSDLGFQTRNGSLYVAVNEATKNTTTIDFRLFLEILSAGVYGKDTKENMKKVFQLYDDNKTDFISKKDLRRVVKELGLPIDETEMEEMIDKADLDADGLVSDEEFYAIMVKKSKKWSLHERILSSWKDS